MNKPRPVVLCVLDGVGERSAVAGNAVRQARTPELDALRAQAPSTSLAPSVDGLPPDGAHGHRCLGAGRPLARSSAPVDADIAARKLGRNAVVDQLVRLATYDACQLHLVTLLSDGTAHASLSHLAAVLEVAEWNKIDVRVHAVLDGRDGPRRAASRQLDALEDLLAGRGKLATVCGRAYAMDGAGRWDRVYAAYHAMVRDPTLGPTVTQADTGYEAVFGAYQKGLDDDQVEPVRVGAYRGMKGSFMCDFANASPLWSWYGEDVGLLLHHRPDGLRQLGAMFRREVPEEIAVDLLTDRGKPVYAFREGCLAALCDDEGALDPVAYPLAAVVDGFAEVVSRAGLRQLRCAESDKAAHVTRYFDLRPTAWPGEEWHLVPSDGADVGELVPDPAAATRAVAASVTRALAAGGPDFVLVNLGGADLAAATGNLGATVAALEALDAAVGAIARAVAALGGVLLVTSDHGRAEELEDDAGVMRLGPTRARVPLLVVGAGEGTALRDGGSLCDVAPTMLELLGLDQPAAMTGQSLLVRPRR
ncbi:MAG: 2,3-bisphosphoglycerate-independent phosphoglycerate mutase [Polyangiaceae bacterium]|nr:2,3-bisphosphoglycerate-independent phosphoglycerate mutase [Polyangiaceae bacterium]